MVENCFKSVDLDLGSSYFREKKESAFILLGSRYTEFKEVALGDILSKVLVAYSPCFGNYFFWAAGLNYPCFL